MYHQRIAAAVALGLAATAAAGPRVIITEIMYNPASVEGRGESEWVEIANVGDEDAHVKGWRLDDEDRDDWAPFDCEIPPGGVVVLYNSGAVTEADFRAAWDVPQADAPGSAGREPAYQAVGVSWGSLGNQAAGDNETLRLLDAAGAVVCEVNYSHQPPWPDLAAAHGSSIALIDHAAENLSDGRVWAASRELQGAWKCRVAGVFAGRDVGSPGLAATVGTGNPPPVPPRSPSEAPAGPPVDRDRDQVPF